MKMVVLALLLSVGATAQARPGDIFDAPSITTMGPALSSFYTTFCADNSMCGNKIILDAKDDAAAFVGSDGALRGAQLEQAIQYIRLTNPANTDSDLALANRILAEQL